MAGGFDRLGDLAQTSRMPSAVSLLVHLRACLEAADHLMLNV